MFSPTVGTRAVGSDGYFDRSSMTRTLDSAPALPNSREKSKVSSPIPMSLATVDSKAKVSLVTTPASVQNTSWS